MYALIVLTLILVLTTKKAAAKRRAFALASKSIGTESDNFENAIIKLSVFTPYFMFSLPTLACLWFLSITQD